MQVQFLPPYHFLIGIKCRVEFLAQKIKHMKLPDPEQFKFKSCTIGGDDCWLIVPQSMGTVWNDENSRFRSCIVRKSDNKVVSQLFKKFVDLGVTPEFQPWGETDNFKRFTAVEKKDGSLLGFSVHNGELIHRTRGLPNAETLPNGHEIPFLINKYPKLVEWVKSNPDVTVLCEWQTKNNIIVCDEVCEPTLTLIGVITNDTAQYYKQKKLDLIAQEIFLPRPLTHFYNHIIDAANDVFLWEHSEGIVVYSEDGQTLKRLKSDWYKRLHKICTGNRNVSSVLDIFFSGGKPDNYQDFHNFIKTTTHQVVADKCDDQIRLIIPAYNEALAKIKKVKDFIGTIENGFSRKEQALQIQKHWKDWRAAWAFLALNKQELNDKILRKAIESELLSVESNSV